jgi:hypothetical protein
VNSPGGDRPLVKALKTIANLYIKKIIFLEKRIAQAFGRFPEAGHAKGGRR